MHKCVLKRAARSAEIHCSLYNHRNITEKKTSEAKLTQLNRVQHNTSFVAVNHVAVNDLTVPLCC